MAVIIIERTADLGGLIVPEGLRGGLYADEAVAHRFVIHATRGGEPVTLDGQVVATFIRADGGTVELTGGLDAGAAEVTLEASCYAVPGRFALTVYNTGTDGSKTAVYACVGTVINTTTDTIIDPGSVVPDVSDIVAEYTAMQAAVDAANAAAAAGNGAALALGPYNAVDVAALMEHNNGTSGGVTFTWNADGSCTVSGTSGSSGASNIIYNSESSFPTTVKPGAAYRILYTHTGTTSVTILLFYFFRNGSWSPYTIGANGATLEIPDYVSGMKVALYVAANKTVDERVTINLIDGLSNNDINDKLILSGGNALDVPVLFEAGVINGVTWTSDGDTVTANGTVSSAGISFLNLVGGVIPEMPSWVELGHKYHLTYSTTDTRIKLQFVFTTGGTQTYQSFTGDGDITIPSDAEHVLVRLAVGTAGTTITNAVMTNIGMYAVPNNQMLADKINNECYLNHAVLTFGTDLDNVKQPGYWCLNSQGGYSNCPFDVTSLASGVLEVLKMTDNVILQRVSVYYGDLTNVYIREAVNGSFVGLWRELRPVVNNTYNNTYTTQHYENTYDITCTPTITTDTNNFLASTGDYTDRTADIQTMLNTTGVCRLGPGRFVVTGVEIPDYAAIIGSGMRTVIVLDDTVTTGYAVKLRNQSSISDVRIAGRTAPTLTATVGTRHGILFEGSRQSGQSGGTTFKKSAVLRCNISNLSGGGITCTGTGLDIDSNILVSDCFIDHCGAGIYIPYYSEFNRFTNNACTFCWYGCVDNGGNNNFVNCDFSGNKIGVLIDNTAAQAPNNTHGVFSGCTINHSYSPEGVLNGGTALKILRGNIGEIFTGLQIHYGAIVLYECYGIRFVGVQFGRSVPITITDSTVVTFSDCTFAQGPTHADSAFSQSNNTVLKFTDCYLLGGTIYDPMA